MSKETENNENNYYSTNILKWYVENYIKDYSNKQNRNKLIRFIIKNKNNSRFIISYFRYLDYKNKNNDFMKLFGNIYKNYKPNKPNKLNKLNKTNKHNKNKIKHL